MRIILLIIILLTILLFSSCVTVQKFSPESKTEYYTKKAYVAGTESIFIASDTTGIALSAESDPSYMTLIISYMNFSDEMIDAIPTLITVKMVHSQEQVIKDENGIIKGSFPVESNLEVFSADRWLKKIQTEQILTGIGMALNQAGESLAASQGNTSYTTGTYGDQYFSATTQTYDPGRSAMLDASHRAEWDALSDQYQREYTSALNTYLDRTTIFPGGRITGMVKVRYRSIGEKYIVTIPFGNDVYMIDLTKIEN